MEDNYQGTLTYETRLVSLAPFRLQMPFNEIDSAFE
jgi:hypothetical protein